MLKLWEKHKYEIVLFSAVLLFCVMTMLFPRIVIGHDFGFHLARIKALSENMQNGHLFSPIYYSEFYGTGYASPMFYGDLFLHIPAAMVLIGFSAVSAYIAFVVLIFLAAAFSSYYCAKIVFKKELPAFVSSFCFVFSGYFATDIYVRAAIGEAQTFVFLPIIALGFYSIVYEDGRHWLCLPSGLFFCLMCHILTTYLCVFALFIFAIISVRHLFKEPRKFLYLVKSAVVFLGISAFFLFPMVEQFASQPFIATSGLSSLINGTLAERAIPWKRVFGDFSIGRKDVWIPHGIGFMPLIAAILFAIIWYQTKKTPKNAWLFGVCGYTVTFLSTNLFWWDLLQETAGIIQFPWRLLVFATLFFAIFVGILLLRCTKRKTVCLFAVLLVFSSIFSYVYVSYSNYLEQTELDERMQPDLNEIGSAEYLPLPDGTVAVDKEGNLLSGPYIIQAVVSAVFENSNKVTSNRISSDNLTVKRYFDKMTVTFSGNTSADAYLDLPLIAYKGYKATINGQKLEVTKSEVHSKITLDREYDVTYTGMLRIIVGDTESGTVTVYYRRTKVQIISYILTFITVIWAVGYIFFSKHKADF